MRQTINQKDKIGDNIIIAISRKELIAKIKGEK